ncbi:ABZJ_00895 family protein [Histidinibacterium aquaticum]|uniref:Uncharacterized protein n=1 Tax=Histidinibacterium aquaticum TaxID=2613962 RepID=A0A5J5GHS1_9RHOB|nr:ABZJ_00895 family protein [Histidinibacterium aquaticum]KAA9007074.1 hypothetical protein F3S47_15020 [Histidinibacterium aquaticum]
MTGGVNLARYAGIYILVLLGVVVIDALLSSFLPFAVPAGAAAIVPPMIAALAEGGRMTRETEAPLSGSAAWRAALLMTIVVVAVNLGFVALVLATGAVAFATEGNLGAMAGLAALLIVAVLVVNRLFLAMGVRNELRLIERRR